jgi:hypothetical protein
MPSQRHYDDAGRLTSTTTEQERVTSFDSFMEDLDKDYDKRKVKSQSKKATEIKTTSQKSVPAPLTLDGPIVYRDQQKKTKKNKSKTSTAQVHTTASLADENNVEQPHEMIYDEDEAWFESDDDDNDKRHSTNDYASDNDEPKRKKSKRSIAHDDGDDRQYYTRLKEFYAGRNVPSHEHTDGQDEVEIGRNLWIPSTVWTRLFK